MKMTPFIALLSLGLSMMNTLIILNVQSSAPSDELVKLAKQTTPLDLNHKYLLKKNDELINEQGEMQIPKEVFYVLQIPGENSLQQYNSGRRIGSSSIDLAPFVGKEVYIDGYFFKGSPLFLVPEYNLPENLRSSAQVVIHIFDVKTEADRVMLENIQETLPQPFVDR